MSEKVLDENLVHELISRISKILALEPIFVDLNNELSSLLKTKVIEEQTPTLPYCISVEVPIGERTYKTFIIDKGGIVCQESEGAFDKIRIKLCFPGIRIEFIDSYSPANIIDGYPVVDLSDLLNVACNVTPEDLDKAYEAFNTKIAEFKEIINKLKKILLTIRMAVT